MLYNLVFDTGFSKEGEIAWEKVTKLFTTFIVSERQFDFSWPHPNIEFYPFQYL